MNTMTKETADALGQDGEPHPRPLTIVVADRGNVWVGHVRREDSDFLIVENARVVRRWGTTNGLNQLATEGPQKSTVLDAAATVHVAKRAIIALIPCEMSKWSA